MKQMTDKEIKKCFKGMKFFKYRGIKYVVSEVDIDIENFIGVYKRSKGIKYCLINYNLSLKEKQRALHELIKDKHVVKF